MQKRHVAARFYRLRDFMHGVGTQDDPFGARLLQAEGRLREDLARAFPVAV